MRPGLAAPAFSAKDVLDLYLHRGSFETVLADEDVEQEPDRWCSRYATDRSPFSINLSTEQITHAPFRLVRRLLRNGSRVTSAASLG